LPPVAHAKDIVIYYPIKISVSTLKKYHLILGLKQVNSLKS